MRKQIIALTIIASLFSCSSNDDSTNASANELLGTWKLQSIAYPGESNSLDDCEMESTLTFNANFSTTYNYSEESGPGNCVVYPYQGEYSISDNVITITETSMVTKDKIVSISENQLVTKAIYNLQETPSGSWEGGELISAEQYIATYVKVD